VIVALLVLTILASIVGSAIFVLLTFVSLAAARTTDARQHGSFALLASAALTISISALAGMN
jgi:hypothetical protein